MCSVILRMYERGYEDSVIMPKLFKLLKLNMRKYDPTPKFLIKCSMSKKHYRIPVKFTL